MTRSPTDTISTQENALRLVGALELLLEAGYWQAADTLYKHDADKGKIFLALPAARLGQRAATAFVATPARREVCAAESVSTAWAST